MSIVIFSDYLRNGTNDRRTSSGRDVGYSGRSGSNTSRVNPATRKLEDAGKKDFYGQQDGELRRTIAGLKGILELNGLLLQDNLTFQRKWKDTDGTVVVKETASEKNGFFFNVCLVKTSSFSFIFQQFDV